MYERLAILAAFVFFYSIVCGGLERTPVSGASFFTAFGFASDPFGLGLLGFQVDAELLRTLESRSRGARRRRPRRPAAQPPPGAKEP